MILCVGEILIDCFKENNHTEKHPGGAPFNVCSNINSFNHPCGFFGSVGDDEDGKYLLDIAHQKHINPLYLTVLKGVETTEAIVSLDNGERSFTFKRDNTADYKLDINEFKKIDFSDIKIVHFGSLMLSSKEGLSFIKEAISYLKDNYDSLLSFDVNYRSDIYPNEETAKKVYLDLLKEFDIVKISDDELNVLCPNTSIEDGIRTLFKINQIVALSLGSKGSVCYYNDKFIKVATYKFKPMDTTGAGDAFYSYILYAFDKAEHLDDENITKIFKRANVCGGLTTLKKGAIDSAPSIQQIEDFLNNEER